MKMMTEQLFIQQGDLSHILSLSWHDVHKISSCGPNTWPIHGGTNILYVLRFLAYTSFSSLILGVFLYIKAKLRLSLLGSSLACMYFDPKLKNPKSFLLN